MKNTNSPEVLFVTSTRIGDAILSSSLLHYIVQNTNNARITVVCGKVAEPLFRHHPNVENIIPLVKQKHSMHWVALWKQLVLQKWDVVIDLRRSLIAYLIYARECYIQKKTTKAKTHRIYSLAKTLNLNTLPLPRIYTSKEHQAKAEEILPANTKVVAIAPTANWNAKIWPPEHFAALINLLLEKPDFKDAKFFITGAPHEKHMVEPLLKELPKDKVIEKMGLDLLTTLAVFEKCVLFIGNDSGLMHLSASAGIPTIGIFGPTCDISYAPWGENACAIRTPEARTDLLAYPEEDRQTVGKLMRNLKPEDVYDKILELGLVSERHPDA